MSNLSLSAVLKIVDEASKPLKVIKQLSDSSSHSIEDLTRSIDRLNSTLGGSNTQRYNQNLKQTEKSSHGLRNATRMLISEFGQVDNALGHALVKLNQWDEKLKQSRQSMRAEFKSLAINTAIAGAGIYKFLQPAIDFEKQMSRVQAVLDLDKNSSDMQKLLADARQQGAASSFSPTEAAQAQHALASGGFSTQQILDSLKGTLQLAEAGQVELARAAQIAVGTLNGFGLQAKEITRVNDILLRATDLTATSVDGFGETMKYVAPIAKAYGASIEETSAMIGLLGNNNILDSQAGTSLRGIMTRFAAPPTEAAKVMNKLNLQFKDSKGNLRDMSDIFNEINLKTKNLGEAGRLEVFKKLGGQEAISAFAVLVDQSVALDENTGKTVNKIKDLTNQLENSEGAAAKAAAILKDNLAGDLEQLTGGIQDLSISFLNVLGTDLRSLITGLTKVIERIKNWVDANPELVRTIAKIAMQLLMLKVAWLGVRYTSNLFFGTIISIAAGITKLTILLFILQKIASKLGIGLPSRLTIISKTIQWVSRAFMFLATKAIPLVIAGLRAMMVAMLTNPLTWIIALITVVALAIYRYWQPIKAFFKGFWDGLKIGLAPVMDSIRTAFSNLKTTLAPLQPVWDFMVSAWTIFKGVLSEMLTPMQATNQELQNATSYGQTLGQFIGVLVGIFVEAFMTIGRVLGETTAKIFLFVQNAGVAWESFKTSVASVGVSLVNSLLTPVNSIIQSVNVLINTINKIPMINIPNIPTIPKMGMPTGTLPTTPTAPTTKPVSTVTPFKIGANKPPVTNHFAAAQIHVSGVSDTNAVSSIVSQQLRQHQLSLAGQMNRSYSDDA